MATDFSTLVPHALRTLFAETMFHAGATGGFILNPGEPGLIDTLKALSAEAASTPPGPGRKPIVSHANHVLFGWNELSKALHGDETAFIGADWNAAWKLERVNDAEWQALLAQFEKVATELLELAPKNQVWNEMMFTGLFASAAHTAYHLGAIRQMLRDLNAR